MPHQPTTRKIMMAVSIATIIAGAAPACSAPTIEARGPYLCHVIPKNAVPLVALPEDEGAKVESEILEGNFFADGYSCIARKGFSDLGYQHWRSTRVDEVRKGLLSRADRYSEAVPPEMGEGFTDDIGGPGWVHWRCDSDRVLSKITYPGDRDRDIQEDLLQLLEIAQQRYAELNDCEIRPPE